MIVETNEAKEMDQLTAETAAAESLFDRSISLWVEGYARRGGKIFCSRGCRGCCSLAVNCTFPEAVRVARALTEEQARRVADRVAILQSRVPQLEDLKSFLRLHRNKLGYCPLLNEDGACGIYEARPLSCRSLLATKESRWCSADFSSLSSEEKRHFVESLDRSAAAFPMHYVAAMQELGRELEAMTAQKMETAFGFSLYGNLPVLIWLEREKGLSEACASGAQAVIELLAREEVLHPFLVTVSEPARG